MTSTHNSTSYLLDTHIFLWMIQLDKRLSERVKDIVLDKENELFLSKVSYWEICLKLSKHKLQLGMGCQSILEEERQVNRIHWLEIKPNHCEQIISMEFKHKDPFDRLLIAQAQIEQYILISSDEKIHQYDVNVVY